MTLTDSTAAASPPSTKTGLEHCGWELLTDCTGSTGKAEAFARYTESEGLPSSTIRCIREDGVGRLWLSTQKGISRFDPQRETFRNYDVSDGLQSNEFSHRLLSRPGWGDVLWRQQWVQCILP